MIIRNQNLVGYDVPRVTGHLPLPVCNPANPGLDLIQPASVGPGGCNIPEAIYHLGLALNGNNLPEKTVKVGKHLGMDHHLDNFKGISSH